MLNLQKSCALALSTEYYLVKLLLRLEELLPELSELLVLIVVLAPQLAHLMLVQRIRHKCCIAMHFSLLDLPPKCSDLRLSEGDLPLQLVQLVLCLPQYGDLLLVLLLERALQFSEHLILPLALDVALAELGLQVLHLVGLLASLSCNSLLLLHCSGQHVLCVGQAVLELLDLSIGQFQDLLALHCLARHQGCHTRWSSGPSKLLKQFIVADIIISLSPLTLVIIQGIIVLVIILNR